MGNHDRCTYCLMFGHRAHECPSRKGWGAVGKSALLAAFWAVYGALLLVTVFYPWTVR